MLRHLAPAGAPIHMVDLLRWAGTALTRNDVAEALRADLCSRFGVRHVFLTSTGRAGMTLLLRAMRRMAPAHRDEVIVPSYTCYSVAASVVKAGLRPRIIDIAPDTLGYAPRELARADYSRVLALIATNLYGFPNDLPALSGLTREAGVFLIDDAAQAMGASVGGRWSGTWGDAGLFSFDKGKNVSAIDGGAVVTDSDDVAAVVRDEMAELRGAGISASGMHVAKALAYFTLLRPWLYGIPARIPQLDLGRTVYSTDYQLALPDWCLVGLAVTMMRRLDEFTQKRMQTGAALEERLRAGTTLQIVRPINNSVPVYLRLPVICPSPDVRQALLSRLVHDGLGATASYPRSLADVPELSAVIAGPKSCAVGRQVAARILTLPTHPFVSAADIDRIIRAALDVLELAPRASWPVEGLSH